MGMKRHPALLQLSREHHGALKLARDAQRAAESGAAADVARLAQRVVDLYATELDAHFLAEEGRLLPALARAGAQALVRRTLAEHAVLRDLVAALRQPEADAPTLLRFAEAMAAHVRFEERALFETAQSLGVCGVPGADSLPAGGHDD